MLDKPQFATALAFGELSVAAQRAVDELCQEFIERSSLDHPPTIESYRNRIVPELWPTLLAELIAEQLERYETNDHARTEEEFLLRFPEAQSAVRAVFELHRSQSSPDANDTRRQGPTVPAPDSSSAREPEVAELETGMLVGVYRLDDRLGEGAMGSVWRAFHTRLKKPVAIKFLRRALLGSDEAVRRFELEMEAIGRFDEPHVARALDAGDVRGWHYLVMDYVEGADLQRRVASQGPFLADQALDLIQQAARGLEAIHARGLTHRDIKPSNLLLGDDGMVRILDLGLARSESAQRLDDQSVRSYFLGTPDYMAPEQWRNSHLVEPSADIYALGGVLYFLVEGRKPFRIEGRGRQARRLATAHDSSTMLDSIRDSFLRELLRRMLADDPGDRPTASEVAQWIAARQSPGAASSAPRPTMLPALFDGSRRWLVVALACASLAVAIGYGAFRFANRPHDKNSELAPENPKSSIAHADPADDELQLQLVRATLAANGSAMLLHEDGTEKRIRDAASIPTRRFQVKSLDWPANLHGEFDFTTLPDRPVRSVRSITLINSRFEDQELWAPLWRRFPNLEDVRLQADQPADAQKGEDPGVRLMSIEGGNVRDDSLRAIVEKAPVDTVRVLHIASPALTDKGLESLSRFEGLERLHLQDVQVGDATLAKLARLPRLHTLTLHSVKLDHRALVRFKDSPSFNDLRVHGDTKFVDEFLALLPEKQDILELVDCPITDRGLDSLEKLARLRYLDLTGTLVSDQGLERLRKALPKCEVRRDRGPRP